MNIEVSTKTLRDGLGIVSRASSSRIAASVLSNVLLETDGEGGLFMTCTNLDLYMRKRIPCEISEPGKVCVPVRLLVGVAGSISGDSVSLAMKSNRLEIKSGPSKFRLVSASTDEFPPMREADGQSLSIDCSELNQRVKFCRESMSSDETRHILNGIYLTRNPSGISLVATDGRRLHISSIATPGAPFGVIVPSMAIKALAALLDVAGNVEITLNDRQIQFEFPDAGLTIVSKVVEGNYPIYSKIIPSSDPVAVVVDREKFIASIHRVALATDEKSNNVKFTIGSGSIDLKANSAEFGDGTDSIEVSNDAGPNLLIACNPRFLLDVLKNCPSDTVSLFFTGPAAPIVIKDPALSMTAVVMPVQVS